MAGEPLARQVLVAAVDMGYGHLRAAAALASALQVPLLRADGPPLASPGETRLWNLFRAAYTGLSRASQGQGLGRLMRWALESITEIPRLYPYRDLSSPNWSVRFLDVMLRAGLGKGVVAACSNGKGVLVTTFFAPALAAARVGLDKVVCVVTDSDIARAWVPAQPAQGRILYCAPSHRAARRLRAYGVPPEAIALTGFPLPLELLFEGQEELQRQHLMERLARLDPQGTFRRQVRQELQQVFPGLLDMQPSKPPHLTFAVGGAGAQASMARQFLPSLAPLLRQKKLRLTLVAGLNPQVAQVFAELLQALGLSDLQPEAVRILLEPTWERYWQSFNRTLAETDILWTKPSELTFYGALGIALIFAPPVGVHEVLNRRWAMELGAGLKQEHPAAAGQWLSHWLEDGILAGVAWSGFRRLPRQGTSRILRLVQHVADSDSANLPGDVLYPGA
ncbi:MAG: hypothetical protein N2447_02270 [Thermoanaerobaculum sp.]|nr:hypothetical protein [Thermoanaerobaculum sp.]